MAVYELHARSKPDGDFAAAWFDDDRFLWDEPRLRNPQPLAGSWAAPPLKLHKPGRGATAVLFNPNAFAVSAGVRDELADLPGIEFLPVQIEGCGTFYLIHVTICIDIPEGAKVNSVPAGGNVVRIESFPIEFAPNHPVFRVCQPESSPSGRAGKTVRAVFVNEFGAKAISSCAGQFLELHPVASV